MRFFTKNKDIRIKMLTSRIEDLELTKKTVLDQYDDLRLTFDSKLELEKLRVQREYLDKYMNEITRLIRLKCGER